MYEIKKGFVIGFDDTSDEEIDLMILQIHMVNEKVKDNDNQTIEEMTNTK